MAALRRLGRDTVGLGAAGIIIGTGLVALGAPLILTIFLAAVGVALIPRGAIFAVFLGCCFLLSGVRGIGERATVFDPGRSMRDRILTPLIAAVPGDAGALAAGLTLGDARYFSAGFRVSMKESATTHLVALSGFNVAFLLGALRRVLRRHLRTRTVAITGCVSLLALLLVAGFQPSLVRASLVGAAVLVTCSTGRRLAPGRLLFVIAAAMLLVQPTMVTHFGFLLSFTSSWALLATVGDMEHLLVSGRHGSMKAVISAILPTAVAQIGVAPVLLASVGSTMLVGLLVNPLVIPLAPFLTVASGIELLVAHVAPTFAALTGSLISVIAWPAITAIRLASHMPLAVSFALPAWIAAAFYVAWIAHAYVRKPRLW